MFKNKKFAGYAVLFMFLGIIYMFMYSGLQNDQINIINTFTGWSTTATQVPMTVGNFVCIALTFVFGTLFIKIGVKKTLIPCIIISALGCIGIAAANGLTVNGGSGNFGLFWISLFATRCCCMALQMGGFMLCANWFIRYRGRVMGIITLGSPLFSIIGTSVMTTFIQNHLSGDYRPFYIGIAVILVIMALLTLVLKDTPEDAGLFPDGQDHAPASEAGFKEVQLTVKQVLSESRGWKLIISFGAFQFIINACMGSMAVRYMALGSGAHGEPIVWLQAVVWLSFGAALGIPMSFIFGVLDDKLGSIKASMVLGFCEFIPVLALMFQPEGGSVPLMIAWGFGVACMTGGVPTMHPCITAYVYGRREYQSANRIIMAIQLIPSAVAAMMMIVLINSGKATLAYGILLVIIVIGLIATASMLKMRDANELERDYIGNKKEA